MSSNKGFCKIQIAAIKKDDPPLCRRISTNTFQHDSGFPSIEKLKEVVSKILNEIELRQKLECLRYPDNDGDLIDITTDDELNTFLQLPASNKKMMAKTSDMGVNVALFGKTDAKTTIDYASIAHESSSKPSFWKLLDAAKSAYQIPADMPIVAFSVSKDWDITQIHNDIALVNHLKEHDSQENEDGDAYIAIVGSSLSVVRDDVENAEIPLSTLMTTEGVCSFQKLLNVTRSANLSKPIKSFLYLDPANGKKRIINSDADLLKAVKENTNSLTLTIHPKFQDKSLLMDPRFAKLSGECDIVNPPMRLRLNGPNATASFNLQTMVPGVYRVRAEYFRKEGKGDVKLYAGKVVVQQETTSSDATASASDDKSVSTTSQQSFTTRSALTQYTLEETGSSPNEAQLYRWVEMGQFEINGSANERFVVSAQTSGDPTMGLREMYLVYLGIW